MKDGAEYKKRIESRASGILEDLKAKANTNAIWTFWQATGQECYYIKFNGVVPEEIIKKAAESMTKAFWGASVARRGTEIIITPKHA